MIPNGTSSTEIVIVVILVTAIGCGLIGALFYFTRPQADTPPKPTIESAPIGGTPPHNRPKLADVIMSRLYAWSTQNGGNASTLADRPENGLHPIATPRKPAKNELTSQGLDDDPANDMGDITPVEVRAIIRQQARAEAIVLILKAAQAGKIKSPGDQAALIEAVSGASRTSRPNSPYSHLKLVVDDLRKDGPRYQKLDEQHRPIGITSGRDQE
jgi:hypothetical protein